MNTPGWTVLYNICVEGSTWIGTGWEFFDGPREANKRYEELKSSMSPVYVPTLRPYHKGVDFQHLGAIHKI